MGGENFLVGFKAACGKGLLVEKKEIQNTLKRQKEIENEIQHYVRSARRV